MVQDVYYRTKFVVGIVIHTAVVPEMKELYPGVHCIPTDTLGYERIVAVLHSLPDHSSLWDCMVTCMQEKPLKHTEGVMGEDIHLGFCSFLDCIELGLIDYQINLGIS